MTHPSTDHLERPAAQPGLTRHRIRIGRRLVAATMAYNIAALWAGAPADSIVLVGVGLDSYIECAAAAALLWHLTLGTRRAHPATIIF